MLNEKFACEGGYPPLVDVQPASRHMASAEGDEREAAMTVDGDGHAKRQSMRHVMLSTSVDSLFLPLPCCTSIIFVGSPADRSGKRMDCDDDGESCTVLQQIEPTTIMMGVNSNQTWQGTGALV